MQSSLSRFLAVVVAAAAFFASGAALAQKVRLATSMGDIVVELDPAKAPKSVANFVQYVKAGQYDGTIFHRVIPNFMRRSPQAPRARPPRRGLAGVGADASARHPA